MPGFGLSSSRDRARALIIGSPASRAVPEQVLDELGYQTSNVDDPYTAMAELCRQPLVYGVIVLSLRDFYREELQIIPAVKRRFPEVDIWLAQSDGRAAALAEATRLGADGLLSDEGLHRFAETPSPAAKPGMAEPAPAASKPVNPGVPRMDEPVLTAEELRALLHEPNTPTD